VDLQQRLLLMLPGRQVDKTPLRKYAVDITTTKDSLKIKHRSDNELNIVNAGSFRSLSSMRNEGVRNI